jgi:hypothetical protein
MKKVLLMLIVVAVIVVSAIGYLIFIKQGAKPDIKSPSASSTAPNVSAFKKACEVMTQADAEAVLGTGAVRSTTAGASDVVNNDTSVTTCSYQVESGTSLKQATVLLRASVPREAQAGFMSAKQSDAKEVADLGEAAYWSATYGQLNVLKGGTWMILSVGAAPVRDHSLPESKILAERLVGKL